MSSASILKCSERAMHECTVELGIFPRNKHATVTKVINTMRRTKTSGPLWSKRPLPIQQRFCCCIFLVSDTAGLVDSNIVGMLCSASMSFEVLVMSTNHDVTVQTPCLVHVTTNRCYPAYIQPVLTLLYTSRQ